MDGIIIINKPLGLSSHDCVSTLRKVYNTKKVGHSGTLDKEASGVLVLGINKGTKLLNYLNQDDKIYAFTVKFGILTDTLDHTGTILKEEKVPALTGLKETLETFKGTYYQVPPSYSAVKVKGKKLYEYARNNERIPDVLPREIKIHELYQTDNLNSLNHPDSVSFIVHASKGLYVRKLALDLAMKLGTIAHTTRIHRLKAGHFTIEEAIPLSLVKADTPILSMNDALKDMSSYQVDEAMYTFIQNGRPLQLDIKAPIVKLINQDHHLLAIYEKKDTMYYAKNVFM
ncbi:MAG: tRNA pseudouridine(55) synthase TruB [Candidatus Izemoplasmataceae bacterium]